MASFIVRRLAISIPIILISTVIVFVITATAADPVSDLRVRPGVTEKQIQQRMHQLGLDRPVMVRYADWIQGMVKGDMGRSLRTNEEIAPLIRRRFGVTLRLVTAATLLSMILAIIVGVVQALRQYSRFDYAATFSAFLFYSMPVFWFAAILKDIGIRLNESLGRRIFFTVGEQTPNLEAAGAATIWTDRIGHLILPGITLILIQMASSSRYQRASMLEVLNADYVRTARAKGLSRRRVIFRHALRNAMIPVVTVTAIQFAGILGGALVTETVYAWSGMGRLLIDALTSGDAPVVQAWLLITATLIVVFNLIADVLYALLDPRIRYG